MSEKMYRYIKIGGTLGAERLWDLIEAMRLDEVLDTPISTDAPLRDKLAIIDDNTRGDWLWFEGVCQDNPMFKNLEDLCNMHGLAYDRHVVSEWSYSGDVRQHRPGTPDRVKITSSVTAEELTPEDEAQIIRLLDDGDAEEAMRNYDKAVTAVDPLPPFRII